MAWIEELVRWLGNPGAVRNAASLAEERRAEDAAVAALERAVERRAGPLVPARRSA